MFGQLSQHFQRFALILSVFAIAMGSSKCVGQISFKHTYAFGDSLTHNDLVHVFFEGVKYQDYGADPIEGLFNQCSQPGDKLHCYARLSSYSCAILKQVKKYERNRARGKTPNGTFFSLQAGGNDLLYVHNLKRLADSVPGDDKRADAIVDRIVSNIREGVNILKRTPAAKIVVWTVPDITVTPMVKDDWQNLDLNEQQLSNVRLHIHRLNDEIKKLSDEPRVNILDIHAIFNRLVVQSTLHQSNMLLHTTLDDVARRTAVNFPVIACGLKTVESRQQQLNIEQTPVELFADLIHPNAAVNQVVTQHLVETLAETSQPINARPSDSLLASNE